MARCVTMVVVPLLAVLGFFWLRGPVRAVGDTIILFNKITGWAPEPGNSDEYNAVLYLVSLLPFAGPGGAAAVSQLPDDPCVESIDALRLPYTSSALLHADHNGHAVPFRLTQWGGGEPELTLIHAHGGGVIGGCMDNEQMASDHVALVWKEQLGLSSVQAANVEYRVLPDVPLQEVLGDYLAVSEALLARGVPPRSVVFTGCSGGADVALFSYLQLLRPPASPLTSPSYSHSHDPSHSHSAPGSGRLPGLVVAHSPGPGFEWTPGFGAWEDTPEWRLNDQQNHAFFFSREAARQWGWEWDARSKAVLESWLADQELIARLGPEVIFTSAQHEMFAAPHRAFRDYATRLGAELQFLLFPNRTHCLQSLATALTGADGVADIATLFKVVKPMWTQLHT